jgi:hypothetical protein
MRRSIWQRVLAAAVFGFTGLSVVVPFAEPAAAVDPVGFEVTTTLTDGPVKNAGSVTRPRISPDGLWTLFFDAGGLRSVPTAGGRIRTLDPLVREVHGISDDSARVVYSDEKGVASRPIAGADEVRLYDGNVDDIELEMSHGYVVMFVETGMRIVPVSGGAPLTLPAPFSLTDVDFAVVSPLGDRVVVGGLVDGVKRSLFSIPTDGRPPALLHTLAPGEDFSTGHFSPDGSTVVYSTASYVVSDTTGNLYSVGADAVVHAIVPNVADAAFGLFSVATTATHLFAYFVADGRHYLVRSNYDGSVVTILYTAPDGASLYSIPHPVEGAGRVIFPQSGATEDLLSVRNDGSSLVTIVPRYTRKSFFVSPFSNTVVSFWRTAAGIIETVQAPVDGSRAAAVLFSPAATFSAFTADGRSAVVGVNGSPWLVSLRGAPSAVRIAPTSGTVDNANFTVTKDGRRTVVMQDQVADGRYGIYSYGPSYDDGKHALFFPLTPARLLDTRPGNQVGYAGAKPAPGAVVRLNVRGPRGVPAALTDLKAVVLNVTVVDATDAGYVTVWPSGTSQPLASNVNVEQPGQTRPNLVTVQVGADDSVLLFTSSGAHLLADIAGYYLGFSEANEGRFFPLPPSRLLDTRSGARPRADTTVGLAVVGRGGLPDRGVAAVVLNVTATDSAAAGYVTVWPSGSLRPIVSNLNLERSGQTIPNQVIVPVGADGAVNLFTDGGTHLIVDVAGWYTDSTEGTGNSGLFVPVAPKRTLDTRPDNRLNWGGPKPTASALVLVGYGGSGAGVSAYVATVTMTEASAPGFVTAYPSDQRRPTASNLNAVQTGQTIANHVTVSVGYPGQDVLLYTDRGTHLIADVNGFFRS